MIYNSGGVPVEQCCCEPEEASPVHSHSGHEETDKGGNTY